MAKTDYKTIDKYHEAFPAELSEKMQAIRDVIHKIAPDAEETISYQIPCFKSDGILIYYSAYTNHISLSYPFSANFLEHFKHELKRYKVSKSAIQIPNKDDLPLQLISEMIKFRKSENEAAPKKKK